MRGSTPLSSRCPPMNVRYYLFTIEHLNKTVIRRFAASSIVTRHATTRLILKHESSFIFIGVSDNEPQMPGALLYNKITFCRQKEKIFLSPLILTDPSFNTYFCDHIFIYFLYALILYALLDKHVI